MKPLVIVDGYNVIGAWPAAQENAWSMDECRDRLVRMAENYAGFSDEEIVIVFDGYLSDRRIRSEDNLGSVKVIYTMRDETADSYIERLVAQTPKYRSVRVATSDGLVQSQVFSTGAIRMTSRELLREMEQVRRSGIKAHMNASEGKQNHVIGDLLEPDVAEAIERIRRG